MKNENILNLMKNKYGSFILMKILNVCDQNNFKILLNLIKKKLTNIHTPNFHNKWQKYIEENNRDISMNLILKGKK